MLPTKIKPRTARTRGQRALGDTYAALVTWLDANPDDSDDLRVWHADRAELGRWTVVVDLFDTSPSLAIGFGTRWARWTLLVVADHKGDLLAAYDNASTSALDVAMLALMVFDARRNDGRLGDAVTRWIARDYDDPALPRARANLTYTEYLSRGIALDVAKPGRYEDERTI